MKYILVFIILFGLNAGASAQIDSSIIRQHFAGHSISYFLKHDQIPQVCKDLFLKKRAPIDDSDILSLMDSIFTNNNDTRPFYFLTITQTMEKADGAYAEPLGMMAKSFVEKRTKDFIGLFENESLLTKRDFDEWAMSVAGEIEIMSEGKEQLEIANVQSKMILNCSDCTDTQKKLILDFITTVRNHCP